MTRLFELWFTGMPDQVGLTWFCQLLDMRPQGRLDDLEDALAGEDVPEDEPLTQLKERLARLGV